VELAKLRQVMGDRYASYYSEWQTQLQLRAAEREARKQREEAETERLNNQRRENERRVEEMRRPSERPEIP
jgi:hypothetical protein